ncbi:MICOS complex subunit MIC25 isoform X3 [Cervus elaphus]|uniref:MICOS complex subunit MIC25 isoform X3 n=1 Tax=Cervus elaphus TaxID=9860 RepID=UPI001CC2E910|nr:MICOS complex subunit MIC25 isoform X3 [Cervus elaphus]
MPASGFVASLLSASGRRATSSCPTVSGQGAGEPGGRAETPRRLLQGAAGAPGEADPESDRAPGSHVCPVPTLRSSRLSSSRCPFVEGAKPSLASIVLCVKFFHGGGSGQTACHIQLPASVDSLQNQQEPRDVQAVITAVPRGSCQGGGRHQAAQGAARVLGAAGPDPPLLPRPPAGGAAVCRPGESLPALRQLRSQGTRSPTRAPGLTQPCAGPTVMWSLKPGPAVGPLSRQQPRPPRRRHCLCAGEGCVRPNRRQIKQMSVPGVPGLPPRVHAAPAALGQAPRDTRPTAPGASCRDHQGPPL